MITQMLQLGAVLETFGHYFSSNTPVCAICYIVIFLCYFSFHAVADISGVAAADVD